MVAEVIALCTQAVSAVNGWIVDIFEATDAIPIYIGLLVVLMVFRFIFEPVFGHQIATDLARADAHLDRRNERQSSVYYRSSQANRSQRESLSRSNRYIHPPR